MKQASRAQDFEKAATVRNQLTALQNLNKQIIFSDKEFLDISKDHALNELVELLGLGKFPQRIEGYDISHMSGTDVVASMVVFTNGASDKAEYRKFKTKKDRNDDFANIYETLSRRLSEKNVKAWGRPSLVLIDGGKGQLDAATRARNEQAEVWSPALKDIPFIGLAKREEQIVTKHGFSKVIVNPEYLHKLGGFTVESEDFTLINLPHSANLVKLLQRIRDESHRFAVSYHTVLRRQGQTASLLDEIPGVGPATRKKLLKKFGSMKGISEATQTELAIVLGDKKAAVLKGYLAPLELRKQ